jgi:hypothetical protein
MAGRLENLIQVDRSVALRKRPFSQVVPSQVPLASVARLAVGLEIFLGIGALFGGGQFILAPDGHLLGLTVRTLAATPFHSFLIPGILLFTFVGVGPLVAAALTAGRRAIAPLAAVAVGVTLMGWVTVEMVMLAGFTSLLWALYLALGTAIAAVGVSWWQSEHRSDATGTG